MKNKIVYIITLVLSLFILVGCDTKVVNNTSNEREKSVKISIDSKEYIINLEDNETVKSFIELLPLDFNMQELNGNEKYVYLDKSLPTSSSNPRRINAGDVMLYGNNFISRLIHHIAILK